MRQPAKEPKNNVREPPRGPTCLLENPPRALNERGPKDYRTINEGGLSRKWAKFAVPPQNLEA
jgi:hypothetical protein